MATVWVVAEGSGGGFDVRGAYATRDAAEAEIITANAKAEAKYAEALKTAEEAKAPAAVGTRPAPVASVPPLVLPWRKQHETPTEVWWVRQPGPHVVLIRACEAQEATAIASASPVT